MRTRAEISQFVLVELKRGDTPLLDQLLQQRWPHRFALRFRLGQEREPQQRIV